MNNGDDLSRGQSGFTYLALMFAVAIAGAVLAATGVVWSQASRRDKEAELLFVGKQFRQAIALYYQRTPGSVKRYPESIEDLTEDRRFLTTQRYLRRIYRDPMTGEAKWGLVHAPAGGVMGVFSLSNKRPLKSDGFSYADTAAGFATAATYADWKFVYVPPTLSDIASRTSSAVLPGRER